MGSERRVRTCTRSHSYDLDKSSVKPKTYSEGSGAPQLVGAVHICPGALPSSPQGPAQLVIIHLGLALADTPEPGHLIRVLDDEFPVVPLPGDDTLVLLLLQQFQDKVPQLDLPRARG